MNFNTGLDLPSSLQKAQYLPHRRKMGFMDYLPHKEKPKPTISTGPTSSSKPRMSVGQNGGIPTYSENARPSLQTPNQRSERYPQSQPLPRPRSQPRTTISTAPPSSHNPWVSVGQNGEISNLSEYAHPDLPQPLNQPSEQYPQPQPHRQGPQRHSQPHPLSHPQSQYQPRLYPHPARRPEQNVARTPGPTKAENYFPPQYPNPSSSITGSFANQPAALAAGYNNQDSHSSRAPQPSKNSLCHPLPAMVMWSTYTGTLNKLRQFQSLQKLQHEENIKD